MRRVKEKKTRLLAKLLYKSHLCIFCVIIFDASASTDVQLLFFFFLFIHFSRQGKQLCYFSELIDFFSRGKQFFHHRKIRKCLSVLMQFSEVDNFRFFFILRSHSCRKKKS